MRVGRDPLKAEQQAIHCVFLTSDSKLAIIFPTGQSKKHGRMYDYVDHGPYTPSVIKHLKANLL